MGIIIKQSIKGTFWIYVGVLIGFITTTYLYPNYLKPEVVGLFSLLVSYSILLGRIFLLGLPGVTSRMFPYFRDENKRHNGFLFIALIYIVLGSILFIVVYSLFKNQFIEANITKSPLLYNYFIYIIPVTISYMVYLFLDGYCKMLYNAVLGTFLQEFIQRLLILLITLSYAFKIITLHQLILSYSIVVSLKGFFLLLYLLSRGEINISPKYSFLSKKLIKEILNVSVFGLLSGVGSILIFNIDKIVIYKFLDLSKTGIYTIGYFFGAVVAKPSISLLKISGTLIAEAWKTNDAQKIKIIYYKSCLNQIIIGGFIFLGIWVNIENILFILGDEYLEAKWVIFFTGLAYLVDMSTGANALIIGLSKYYKINPIFQILLDIIAVGTMFILIPIWGITGAAIAITLSITLNNFLRFLFLKIKYDFQPFNYAYLIIIAFYFFLFLIIKIIPQQNVILDIIIRSMIVSILTLLFFWRFQFSPDIKNILIAIKELPKKMLVKK